MLLDKAGELCEKMETPTSGIYALRSRYIKTKEQNRTEAEDIDLCWSWRYIVCNTRVIFGANAQGKNNLPIVYVLHDNTYFLFSANTVYFILITNNCSAFRLIMTAAFKTTHWSALFTVVSHTR